MLLGAALETREEKKRKLSQLVQYINETYQISFYANIVACNWLVELTTNFEFMSWTNETMRTIFERLEKESVFTVQFEVTNPCNCILLLKTYGSRKRMYLIGILCRLNLTFSSIIPFTRKLDRDMHFSQLIKTLL